MGSQQKKSGNTAGAKPRRKKTATKSQKNESINVKKASSESHRQAGGRFGNPTSGKIQERKNSKRWALDQKQTQSA